VLRRGGSVSVHCSGEVGGAEVVGRVGGEADPGPELGDVLGSAVEGQRPIAGVPPLARRGVEAVGAVVDATTPRTLDVGDTDTQMVRPPLTTVEDLIVMLEAEPEPGRTPSSGAKGGRGRRCQFL
jgi:hypothetical protein